jgi:hypothetical protein
MLVVQLKTYVYLIRKRLSSDRFLVKVNKRFVAKMHLLVKVELLGAPNFQFANQEK